AHPADEIPRIACQAIAQQLGLAGVSSVVLELPPGETVDDDGRWLLFSSTSHDAAALKSGVIPDNVLKQLKARQFAVSDQAIVEEMDDHWIIRDLKDGRSFTAKHEDDELRVYVNVDLRYMEVFMWEPLVDARKLLAVDGIATLGSAHTELALRRLDRAVNWSLARRYLFELHSLSQRNGMVIPLWQLVEHYAYRKSVQGMGSHILSIYQNVRQWQNMPTFPKANQAATKSP
ncbi:MAG: hypothetical protein IH991_20935, partial [Planctomycetes bacterium]|nr:hypothetical protein [Planctomycetota bacterium]